MNSPFLSDVRRCWHWGVPVLLLTAAVAVFVLGDMSPSPAHGNAGPGLEARLVQVPSPAHPTCGDGVAAPPAAFDIVAPSPSLSPTNESQVCAASPQGGPSTATYVSAVYGTCDDGAAGDCAPPLEIQTWPACDRNAASYDSAAPDSVDVEPMTSFEAAGSIAARSFERGTRQEVYLPTMTVVVFAVDASLARSAADAVARAAANTGVNDTADPNATKPPTSSACGTAAAAAVDNANRPRMSLPTVDFDSSSQNLDATVEATDPAPPPDAAAESAPTPAGSTP